VVLVMRESPILHDVRAVLAQSGPCWRNNTGVDLARGVRYGLGVGGADLISIAPIVVTPEMVGATIGRFVGIEVKTPTGRLTAEQRLWRDAVTRAGAFYAVARSAEEAADAVVRARMAP
jgi:hypothetical protein